MIFLLIQLRNLLEQVSITGGSLLRIKIIGLAADVLGEAEWDIPVSQQHDAAVGSFRFR